jgi:integrase/recombinase XerD
MSIRTELDPWVEGYLDYLTEVKRNSPGTVKDVRCTFRRVTGMMAGIRPNVALWDLSLEDYLHWLNHERYHGRSEASLAKHISHLRGLLEYAWRSGRSDRNVLDGFSLKEGTSRRQPKALTETEAQQLIAACGRATPRQRRDRTILLLLYGCGLRTQELCQLNLADVDTERRELRIEHGKGDRSRVVPIPAAVFTELLAYLHERRGKRGPLLRTEQKRARVDQKAVSNAVRTAAEAAGFSKLIVPKMLRHAYATHLMDAGVDLAVIASLMGHRSPTETGVYLHVLEDKAQGAVDQLTGEEGMPL